MVRRWAVSLDCVSPSGQTDTLVQPSNLGIPEGIEGLDRYIGWQTDSR